jgi:hypothetical protein
MLAVLFWILFSLMLLIVIPDRWHARREIAKRQGLLSVLRGSEVRDRTIFRSQC